MSMTGIGSGMLRRMLPGAAPCTTEPDDDYDYTVQAMVSVTTFRTMSVPVGRASVQPATPTANPSHQDTGRCPG